MKALGDKIYWVESHTHYGKTIPCPMCFGKRFVTIILGDESHTKSECGMCSHGLEYATGYAKTWDAIALIESGIITGMSTREGLKYEVDHRSVYAHECFDSEDAAIPTRETKLKEAEERRDTWFKDSFIQCKKKQLWSTGYHRECIKSAERNIEWHMLRLAMIAAKKTPTESQDRGATNE